MHCGILEFFLHFSNKCFQLLSRPSQNTREQCKAESKDIRGDVFVLQNISDST